MCGYRCISAYDCFNARTMNTHLVSIITPTYDHERFIGTCIDSVLGQTYADWEQVIVDDGSKDQSGQIITTYNDHRIRYFHQSNQGPFELANTYNHALAL